MLVSAGTRSSGGAGTFTTWADGLDFVVDVDGDGDALFPTCGCGGGCVSLGCVLAPEYRKTHIINGQDKTLKSYFYQLICITRLYLPDADADGGKDC